MWAACKTQEFSLKDRHCVYRRTYNQYWNVLFLPITLRWWRWWLWWYVRSLFAGSPIMSISWFTSSTRTCLSIPSFSRSIWLSCGWQWAPLCTIPLSTAASMTGNFTWSENTVIDAHTQSHLALSRVAVIFAIISLLFEMIHLCTVECSPMLWCIIL